MKEQAKDKFRIQTLPEPPQGQHAQFSPFRPPVPGLPPAFGMQRIRRCLNQVTEIILRGGERIWFYPTALRGRTLVGFRWVRGNWVPAELPLFRIRSFNCF